MMTPLQKLAFGKIQQICFVFFWGRKRFFATTQKTRRGGDEKFMLLCHFTLRDMRKMEATKFT